jgi:acetyltransferase-like isoleucine patch superfamily enzyme
MTTIHPTADVAESAVLGEGVRVWQQAQIRDNARIGAGCNIGKGAYIGLGVVVGANCKIHNYALLHEGAIVADGVFVGPHVVFANDMYPRAINPDGTLKNADDWRQETTRVEYGASVGARSVLLPGVTVGAHALVGAGSVVTRDIPPFGLVVGNPARLVGHVCACGLPSDDDVDIPGGEVIYVCEKCAQPVMERMGLI